MTQQNDPSESLDRLLATLGTVDPDSGFTQRLAQRVETTRGASKPVRQPWLVWTLGFASVCGLALLLPLVLQRTREMAVQTDVVSTTSDVSQPPGPNASRSQDHAAKAVFTRRSVRTRSRHVARRAHTHDDADAAEVASFPAPPLPLTEQERLLARIARQGDEQEMAMLNPEIRASLDARQKAAFHQVFEQGIPQFQNQPITEERGDE